MPNARIAGPHPHNPQVHPDSGLQKAPVHMFKQGSQTRDYFWGFDHRHENWGGDGVRSFRKRIGPGPVLITEAAIDRHLGSPAKVYLNCACCLYLCQPEIATKQYLLSGGWKGED